MSAFRGYNSWPQMTSLFPRPCPPLPEYQSLLVKGLYHASAPIHLLLSHTADDPEARAIILTPRRDAFKNDLVDLNDAFITEYGGHGRNAAAAQRVEIFYPPSLAHLRMLLSMLHEYDDVLHHAKTTLDTAPTLLVLHEISEYFTAQASDATVSAYLSVISSALALTASWSPRW
ncbi:hypothetical protein L226DRAFT_126967 [Lentinus tigrinus ALCF2SS1-7]|uniref:uncharacterized protein n=1 Tax=Lentinus tigrinus ALCF2SS1-7 TaxID=1328758 RepID=UPI00116637D4|nr:hypothetical protein L226DRAFT_126967 [Lentinus tigrinus ALCF2SS1-7]